MRLFIYIDHYHIADSVELVALFVLSGMTWKLAIGYLKIYSDVTLTALLDKLTLMMRKTHLVIYS